MQDKELDNLGLPTGSFVSKATPDRGAVNARPVVNELGMVTGSQTSSSQRNGNNNYIAIERFSDRKQTLQKPAEAKPLEKGYNYHCSARTKPMDLKLAYLEFKLCQSLFMNFSLVSSWILWFQCFL